MVQKTRILFSIVISFGLFHVLRVILNIEEFVTLDDQRRAKDMGCEWLQYWTIIAAPISHVLLQINSSINFFIYCFFNKSFRYELISWTSLFMNAFRTKKQLTGCKSIDIKVSTRPHNTDHRTNNNLDGHHHHENVNQMNKVT